VSNAENSIAMAFKWTSELCAMHTASEVSYSNKGKNASSSGNFLFLILNKISAITNCYLQWQIKKRPQQQNDMRYYMHKNNKLRTHFYDKDAWLLHPGYYYIFNDAFLEKNKRKKFWNAVQWIDHARICQKLKSCAVGFYFKLGKKMIFE